MLPTRVSRPVTWAACVRPQLRGAARGVRHGRGEEEQERLVLVGVDEAECPVLDEVGGVGPAGAVPVLGDVLLPAVVPEVRRVVLVRVLVRQIAVELLEATGVGVARLVRPLGAEAPFADERGAVAEGAQRFGEGEVLLGEGALAARTPGVLADGGVAAVQSGEEGAAGGGADRGGGVGVGEAQSLGGQGVQARGVDQFLAVGTEFAVAEVVGEDDHEVRPPRRGPGGRHDRRGRAAHLRSGDLAHPRLASLVRDTAGRRPGRADGGGPGEETTAAGHANSWAMTGG